MTSEQLVELLRLGVKKGASDLHLEPGYPPTLRIRGELVPAKLPPLAPEATLALAQRILGKDDGFFAGLRHDADRGFGIENLTRVRASVFRQRGVVGMVLRLIALKVPSLAELNLPPAVETLAWSRTGLVLITGPTGNGKSTTIASLIDYMNHTQRLHIVTVEDPIEYLIAGQKSLVIQREVGRDTDSFPAALRSALRQDPDAIMVGEMRDYETADTCLQAAETGHLVISSLHTPDVPRTIGRFIGIFTAEEQATVRKRLADNLKAIVSLRLLPRAGGSGLVPAVEVMLATRSVQEAIRDPTRLDALREIMEKSNADGMQTFDQNLIELCRSGQISKETALHHATSRADVERMLMLTQVEPSSG